MAGTKQSRARHCRTHSLQTITMLQTKITGIRPFVLKSPEEDTSRQKPPGDGHHPDVCTLMRPLGPNYRAAAR